MKKMNVKTGKMGAEVSFTGFNSEKFWAYEIKSNMAYLFDGKVKVFKLPA